MKLFLEIIVVLIVFLVVAWAWIIVDLRRAPEGWEDEEGFHEGKKPEVKK
jgi:hypothetical protein